MSKKFIISNMNEKASKGGLIKLHKPNRDHDIAQLIVPASKRIIFTKWESKITFLAKNSNIETIDGQLELLVINITGSKVWKLASGNSKQFLPNAIEDESTRSHIMQDYNILAGDILICRFWTEEEFVPENTVLTIELEIEDIEHIDPSPNKLDIADKPMKADYNYGIEADIPVRTKDALDWLVECGYFTTFSEAVRYFLVQAVGEYKRKRMEEKLIEEKVKEISE